MIIDASDRFTEHALNTAGANIAQSLEQLRPVDATQLLALMLGELVAANIDDMRGRNEYLDLMHSMSTGAAELFGLSEVPSVDQ